MKFKYTLLFLLVFGFIQETLEAQEHTVPRQWNELLLEAIRDDLARPTVHARNLFHTSILLYDGWAVYDSTATTYFLGKERHGFECAFDSISVPDSMTILEAQEMAMSYAAFRLLDHRFSPSIGADSSVPRFYNLMTDLGYDTTFMSIDYSDGNPAALGNYMANCMIAYGLTDGSNEANDYANRYYEPVNPPVVPAERGNPNIEDPNRWQAVLLDQFIDQSGNIIEGDTLPFLSPEWGEVHPFALQPSDQVIKVRDSQEYKIYLDVGDPPYIDITDTVGSDQYKWGFAIVSSWSSHLDPEDTTMWDISPNSIGNSRTYPTDYADYPDYYDFENGGIDYAGYDVNPFTGEPYEEQIVPRGDYARVIAEFWADGPDSETPPGHWFTLLNTVNDDPNLVKRFQGRGPILDDTEWEVKSYLALGGAMHDAAIAAWSHKGYYDYLRPVSAIRYMADQGQSTYPDSTNYSFFGIPLIPGFIELITEDDPLSGSVLQHVGKIKIKAWRGPDFIGNPEFTNAGVRWIRAEDWWPYQRPTFVTPPFAGYVSGHSTYSRAAAEVLEDFTGDPYFPGGLGTYLAEADEYLVFENGPSVDVRLEWATYVDAANESALSRIWGGIHPPQDDLPGRTIGIQVAEKAFNEVVKYFQVDLDNDGFFSYEDCNDLDSLINPAMSELCDGIDQNCNGEVDEGLEILTYWEDSDGDGFGNADVSLDTCLSEVPQGFSENGADCDDQNPNVYPGAEEVCNNIDDDCNGMVDDGLTFFTYYIDSDGDGYGTDFITLNSCVDSVPVGFASLDGDCNDDNADINPGADEVCNDIDDDCNDEIDDGLPVFTYYIDSDGDGYGSDESVLSTCLDSIPDGYSLIDGDCNDNDAAINPSAQEIPNNGIDENCDSLDVIVSTRDETILDGTKVFPNPTEGTLNVQMPYTGTVILEFYDNTGRILQSVTDQITADETLRVQLRKEYHGLSFLKIIDTRSRQTLYTTKLMFQ